MFSFTISLERTHELCVPTCLLWPYYDVIFGHFIVKKAAIERQKAHSWPANCFSLPLGEPGWVFRMAGVGVLFYLHFCTFLCKFAGKIIYCL